MMWRFEGGLFPISKFLLRPASNETVVTKTG